MFYQSVANVRRKTLEKRGCLKKEIGNVTIIQDSVAFTFWLVHMGSWDLCLQTYKYVYTLSV